MEQTGYVRTDEHGVMRVANTHVMLDSIVAAFDRGHSPETIRLQFPSLSLDQVYGAITYILAYRAEVDEYLRRQDAVWAQWEEYAEQHAPPALQRLRHQQGASVDKKP